MEPGVVVDEHSSSMTGIWFAVNLPPTSVFLFEPIFNSNSTLLVYIYDRLPYGQIYESISRIKPQFFKLQKFLPKELNDPALKAHCDSKLL